MPYRIGTFGNKPPEVIVVVGVGGTGGFVAEGLCRLTHGSQLPILLIDPDRVEERNLVRQAFYPKDLGKFKSQVVAERLAALYGREVAYSVTTFSGEIIMGLHESLRERLESFGRTYDTGRATGWNLVIGCVDNPIARKEMSLSVRFPSWWIDAGNGDNSGQVFIGNCDKLQLKDSAVLPTGPDAGDFYRLPLPTLVEPGLLKPVPVAAKVDDALNCAEAVEQNVQTPVINQMMAALVLEFVLRLIAGKLTWMSAYIDMDAGSLRMVDVSPEAVARLMSMHESDLIHQSKGEENSPVALGKRGGL